MLYVIIICRTSLPLQQVKEFKRNKFKILKHETKHAIKEINKIKNRQKIDITKVIKDEVHNIYMKINQIKIKKYHHLEKMMKDLNDLVERTEKLKKYLNTQEKINLRQEFKYISPESDYISVRTLYEHKSSDSVTILVELENGNLASGSSNGEIIIWGKNKFNLIKKIKGHIGEVKSLVVLKNGNFVSSSDDPERKSCLRSYKTL